nr:Chain A, LYS-ARG-ILE-VAL-LYS-ARG-ILE-LYS-LYS-TRP-LEU-ARG [Homo sapiens]
KRIVKRIKKWLR